MNDVASMLPRKSMLVLMFGLAVLGWFVPQQQRIAEARRELVQAQRLHAGLVQGITEALAAREEAREEMDAQRDSRDQVLSAMSKAERELARVAPESAWATPPVGQPEWSEPSPFVWIRKTMLPKLPGRAFGKNGELAGEAAAVMAIDGASLKALNARLTDLMSQYHALEVAQAERVNEPLPGITKDGPHVTVRVKPLPQEGARFKQQFGDTLRAALGEQRADLLLQSAGGWFDEQFSQSGTEPKTVSVVRHPNGTYNISIRAGNSWMSTGGFRNLGDYVPAHLLPMFSEVLEEGAANGAQLAE